MGLKNGLYLFRETCSSVSLKVCQLHWQTDPYPCSRLGWIIWNEHISAPFTPLCTRAGEAWWWDILGKESCRLPWQVQRHCCFISCVTFAVIKVAAGRRFWGDLPWGWTSLPISNCHFSIWKKAQGVVNRHALPFKCITGPTVLPSLILLFFSTCFFFCGTPWSLLLSCLFFFCL